MSNKFRVKDWMWIFYPVVVVVFIVVSGNLLIQNQDKFVLMLERRDLIRQEEAKLASLRQKLVVLEGVDLESETGNLKLMVGLVPASKLGGVLVSELKQAASESGAILVSYKGSLGNVKEASDEAKAEVEIPENTAFQLDVVYNVSDMEQLRNLVSNLETRVPLIKVSEINYVPGVLELTVEGAWSPWESVAGANQGLPEYQPQMQKVKEKVADYKKFDEVSVDQFGEGTGVVNPF